MFLWLQTPQVSSVLQAAEEPEQHREEQGGAGRPSRQRLQGAAAAHGAARRLALRTTLRIGRCRNFVRTDPPEGSVTGEGML